ncbi:erythroferrone-like isoform X2 [Syngnathus acus]|uniref:erythroferrone-like isoform X2 n=1 Tax=Syngnathus acus TaxID=161584 RepID=UPI001885C9CC|nr:erythroferrone-like isoform X2 [Syngnathus acus]
MKDEMVTLEAEGKSLRHPNMKTLRHRPMMMTMMMMTMMVNTTSSGQEVALQVVQDKSPHAPPAPPSPRTSWLMFINNSDARKSSPRTTKHVPRGPPGSRSSPRRPAPCPYRRQLIDDLLVRFNGASTNVLCGLCERLPRVSTSFLGRLPQAVQVASRSLAPPFVAAFQRGRGFDVSHGRYTATQSGFYLLSARLCLKSGERVQVRLRESVRAAICIESLCRTKPSIDSVVGVATVREAFSITLTGTLFLQAGEYAAIYVDNATAGNIRVLPDSFFSAILLGT